MSLLRQVLYITFALSLLQNEALCEDNLILVHALFRHGDRTTVQGSPYPTDPYINETYYPVGFGELTNPGKLREYNLGKTLRQRYDKFLGDLYTPDILDAWSSDVNRTKASLELVLAGLFPPNPKQRWNLLLNWQPIPYNYRPAGYDTLLSGFSCPTQTQYVESYLQTPEAQKIFDGYGKLLTYLGENIGIDLLSNIYTAVSEGENLYSLLKTEAAWGLILPKWTRAVYPQQLEALSGASFAAIYGGSLELRQLGAGDLLRKIVEDTQAKISGTLIPQDRKLFLYSAHDANVAALLSALNLFKPHPPNYGSTVVIEVRKINGVYGIKVYFYEDPATRKIPELLKVPGFEEFIPLDQFAAFVEPLYLPEGLCGI